jgi:raffinose/stachyose/melibiose transport system substrate-binding protein
VQSASAVSRSAVRGVARAIGFILVGLLAACGSKDSATPNIQRTLEVWTAESGTRLDLVRKRADEFAARHAGIAVNLTVRDFGSYPAQLKLALSSDEAPDVVIGNLGWSLDGPLIRAGMLRDLQPWTERYGWEKRFAPAALRQMQFAKDGRSYGQGVLYGIPYAADVIGWYYNVRKFEALHLALPKNFAELEAALETARAAGEAPIMLGNRPQWPGLHLFYLVCADLGAEREITGIVYGDPSVSWTDAGFLASARKLAQWEARSFIVAGANGLSPADANARFANGAGVLLPAGTWNAVELAVAMGDNVGFFLTPPLQSGAARRATGSIGYGWHITTASRQPDLAAEFIDFMTNEEFAQQLAAGGDLPAFATQVAGPANTSRVAQDIRSAWNAVLADGTLLPYLDFSAPNGSEVLYPTMQSMLAGKVDPTRGLQDIEASRRRFLDSLR